MSASTAVAGPSKVAALAELFASLDRSGRGDKDAAEIARLRGLAATSG